jgi:hypothetical protein
MGPEEHRRQWSTVADEAEEVVADDGKARFGGRGMGR